MATHLSLLLTSCVWGGAVVGVKYLLKMQLDPLALTIGRFAIVAVLLVLILAGFGRKNPVPELRDWPRLVILGLLCVTIYHLALNYGETRVTAAAAGVLLSTSPIITAILSAVILRENLTKAKVGGVVLAFVGVLLVILYGGGGDHGGRMSLWGFLVTMICPVSWAFHNVLSKPVANKLPSFHLTAYTGLIGAAVLMAMWNRGVTREMQSLDTTGWAVLVYLGAICTVLAYALMYRGLRILTVTQVGVYIYLVPVFAMIFACIFLHEIITPFLIVGTAMIIAGIALSSMDGTNTQQSTPQSTG